MKKKLVKWIIFIFFIVAMVVAFVFYHNSKEKYLYSIDSYKMDLVIHEDNTGDYKREIKYTIQSDIKTERIYDYLSRLPEDSSVKINGKIISLDFLIDDDQSKEAFTSLVKTLKKGDKIEVSYTDETIKALELDSFTGFARANFIPYDAWYIYNGELDLLDYGFGDDEDEDKIPPITSSDISIETDRSPEFQLLFVYNIHYNNLFRVFEYASAKEKDGKLYLHTNNTKFLPLEIYFNKDIVNFEETSNVESASFEDAKKIQNNIVENGINVILLTRILPPILISMLLFFIFIISAIFRQIKKTRILVKTIPKFVDSINMEEFTKFRNGELTVELRKDELIENAFLPYLEFIGRKRLGVVLNDYKFFLYLKHHKKISLEMKPLIDILPWKNHRVLVDEVFVVEGTKELLFRHKVESLFSKYLSDIVTVKVLEQFDIKHRKMKIYNLAGWIILLLNIFIYIEYLRRSGDMHIFDISNWEFFYPPVLVCIIILFVFFINYRGVLTEIDEELQTLKSNHIYQFIIEKGIQNEYYRLAFYKALVLENYGDNQIKYSLKNNLDNLANHTSSDED